MNQEILNKAIAKAKASGWDNPSNFYATLAGTLAAPGTFSAGIDLHPFELIFNHDFAKALWGEPREFMKTGFTKTANNFLRQTEGWPYHLQQMVIAEDPITYLGEHL